MTRHFFSQLYIHVFIWMIYEVNFLWSWYPSQQLEFPRVLNSVIVSIIEFKLEVVNTNRFLDLELFETNRDFFRIQIQLIELSNRKYSRIVSNRLGNPMKDWFAFMKFIQVIEKNMRKWDQKLVISGLGKV